MTTFKGVFSIWQINENYHNLRFLSSKRIEKEGEKICRSRYYDVYTGYKNEPVTLDDIFEEFNICHPRDYTGHSLSVSDIITFHDKDGNIQAYFVEPFGYRNVTDDFFAEESHVFIS